ISRVPPGYPASSFAPRWGCPQSHFQPLPSLWRTSAPVPSKESAAMPSSSAHRAVLRPSPTSASQKGSALSRQGAGLSVSGRATSGGGGNRAGFAAGSSVRPPSAKSFAENVSGTGSVSSGAALGKVEALGGAAALAWPSGAPSEPALAPVAGSRCNAPGPGLCTVVAPLGVSAVTPYAPPAAAVFPAASSSAVRAPQAPKR